MEKFTSKEFWQVVTSDMDSWSETSEYYVFANNAASAEKKALILSRKESLTRPYVKSVSFIGYIDA